MHSAIDAHSRLAYSEINDDEKGVTCAEFWNRASAGSSDQRNICSRAVAGVRKPRVLRGRVLSFSATVSRSAWVSPFIDVSLGKY